MTNISVVVLDVIKDRLYDCIVVNLDEHLTQIVFSKADNVEQYLGKEICLLKDDGEDYIISDTSYSPKVAIQDDTDEESEYGEDKSL